MKSRKVNKNELDLKKPFCPFKNIQTMSNCLELTLLLSQQMGKFYAKLQEVCLDLMAHKNLQNSEKSHLAVSSTPSPQPAPVPLISQSEISKPQSKVVLAGRKGRGKLIRDPKLPKPAPSSYILYFLDKKEQLAGKYGL